MRPPCRHVDRVCTRQTPRRPEDGATRRAVRHTRDGSARVRDETRELARAQASFTYSKSTPLSSMPLAGAAIHEAYWPFS